MSRTLYQPQQTSRQTPSKYAYNYKTILCEKWKSSGRCPYNHLCMFAHGKEELMAPGEYNKKVSKPREKRHCERKSSTSINSTSSDYDQEFPPFRSVSMSNLCNLSSNEIISPPSPKSVSLPTSPRANISAMSQNTPPLIKSPLNPKAKAFRMRRNTSEVYYENLEYDNYWKNIHTMIIDSCEEEARQRQPRSTRLSGFPPPGFPIRVYFFPNNYHPPFPHIHPYNPNVVCTYSFVNFAIF